MRGRSAISIVGPATGVVLLLATPAAKAATPVISPYGDDDPPISGGLTIRLTGDGIVIGVEAGSDVLSRERGEYRTGAGAVLSTDLVILGLRQGVRVYNPLTNARLGLVLHVDPAGEHPPAFHPSGVLGYEIDLGGSDFRYRWYGELSVEPLSGRSKLGVTLPPVQYRWDSDGGGGLGVGRLRTSLELDGFCNGLGCRFDSGNWSFVSGALPEPGSWAMMIAGFGLIGATLRRRRPLPVR